MQLKGYHLVELSNRLLSFGIPKIWR